MSTSLVMLETGAHRTHTSNSSSTNIGDVKPTLVPNVPINFAMKFLAANHNSSISNSNNNNNSSTSNHQNYLHYHRNNSNNNNNHHNNIQLHLHASGVAAPVTVKLESPRVPSPCTADLIGKSIGSETRIPSPSITKEDLSFYLTKSAVSNGQQQQLQFGLGNNNNNNKHDSMGSVDTSTITAGNAAFSLKHHHNNHHNNRRTQADDAYLPGQTILPNSTSAVGSPSPPPLLPNYFAQSPTTPYAIIGTAASGNQSTTTLLLKRDHDDAFGPSSTTATIAGTTPTTPVTMNVTSSSCNNNNNNNSLPSSTNSPSPPPLLTNNSHHLNSTILTNGGGNIASPTSSSFSDFGKEDMSPSNSGNGYVDSLGGDPKKKKGPAPRQQEELCLVCGDRASGYHYNALTCEGCKGFFRRSITKNAVYQCKYGNNCEIDMYMRRKCQECRLKKCLSVGMRPECVVPEFQCAIKREAKRAIKEKDKPNSTTKEGFSPSTPQIMVDEKSPLTPQMAFNWCNQNGHELTDIGKKLSHEQEEVIKKLVYYQEEYESPSEDDIKKIAPFPMGENEEDTPIRFQHVTEMTILTVQLIVEFSKRVPCFDKLFREDQITLLKACSSEVMMLRCSRKYDIQTDSIVYANNQPYTRDNYSKASISYVTDSLFNFCRRMCMLKVDNAEYALLTAIVIFSDRPQLLEPRKVEGIQEQYIETLRAYVENHRPANKCHFAKLLSILTELRTLGNINSEMCISLKFEKSMPIPKFLEEIWDLN